MVDQIKDYIDFGDFCRRVLDMQSQTGYYYLEGFHGYPKMKEGLRIIGKNDWDYHTLKIHKDDAKILKKRIEAYQNRFETERKR
jgi:hypothetical protein